MARKVRRDVDAHKRERTLTTPVQQQIISHIESGARFALACELAGVPGPVADRWLSLGLTRLRHIDACERQGVSSPPMNEHAYFAGEVVAAESRAELGMLAIVQKLATDPLIEPAVRLRAATWWLSKASPARYGPQAGMGVPAIAPETPEASVDVVIERLHAVSRRILDVQALPEPGDEGEE